MFCRNTVWDTGEPGAEILKSLRSSLAEQALALSSLRICRRVVMQGRAHLAASSAIVPGTAGPVAFFAATGSCSGVASSPVGEPPAARTGTRA